MSLIQISSPNLRVMVILQLMEHLERGNLAPLVQAGLDPAQIDQLRALQSADIVRLGQMDQPVIGVLVDPDGLDLAFSTLRARAEQEELLFYFVANRASIAMLRRFFTLSRDMIDGYRASYASERRVGRPSLPDADTREEIHRSWAALRESTDLRVRYRKLHQQFHAYSLETLYAVVNEAGEQP
ncbi:STY4526/YPO1902 family pathogenicity island replication protein [Cupriavidus basilensis]